MIYYPALDLLDNPETMGYVKEVLLEAGSLCPKRARMDIDFDKETAKITIYFHKSLFSRILEMIKKPWHEKLPTRLLILQYSKFSGGYVALEAKLKSEQSVYYGYAPIACYDVKNGERFTLLSDNPYLGNADGSTENLNGLLNEILSTKRFTQYSLKIPETFQDLKGFLEQLDELFRKRFRAGSVMFMEDLI